MLNKHLTGLDGDLKKGIDSNRKKGGVSDTLKRLKKRPETLEGQNPNMIAFNRMTVYPDLDKCSCGKKKFAYQKVCYKCNV